jgi:2,4-dienoyl-CoA reductase-like NADH-dependent reductase (Old Yellow Enzyme family)
MFRAHGYLLDQFLADQVNLRDDEFGTQSLENRTRLMSMVIKACIKAFDGDSQRVGMSRYKK